VVDGAASPVRVRDDSWTIVIPSVGTAKTLILFKPAPRLRGGYLTRVNSNGTGLSLPFSRAYFRGPYRRRRSAFSFRLHSCAVPTVLREGPYRENFYSHEPVEPPHMHVDRDNSSAKFWLDPVALAANFGFSGRELRVIETILVENQRRLIRAWNDHFGT
jgi:hypothetical protein